MKELGYDLRSWVFCFQWESGKTLWASGEEDGWSVICDPDSGSVRKQRSG